MQMQQEQEVWLVEKPGAMDRLKLTKKPLKPLSKDHIRVETSSVGLNFADIMAILGLYSATPKEPFTPGLEFSGTVVEIGSDVTQFKIGDKVMGVTRFGAYSHYIDIHPAYCDKLPEGWSFSEGASYIAQAITAWYALKGLGDLRPGQNVLIHSAAGGVGLFAMEYARKLGGRPIGTVSTPEKISHLQSLGFSDVLIRTENFKSDLTRILNGKPLSLALTAIGGQVLQESYDLLSPMGRLIVYGAADYTPSGKNINWFKMAYRYWKRPKFDPLDMIPLNKSIMAFNIIWLWEYRELLKVLLNEMSEVGLVRPYVGKEFSFNDAPSAVDYLKSGKTIGKVVLKIQ